MLSIRHTSPLLRYGVAVLAVGVAFGLKLLLDPLIVQDVPFLLVFGAIMVSAWFGGLGPGLLATVAAGLTTDYFFLDPKGTVSGFSLVSVPLLLFLLEGTLVCLLAEALRAAKSRAESSKLEAERHRERLRRNEEHFRSLVEGMRDYAIFTLELVREVVGEAREVIHDLRPTVLDDFGLAAAVRLQVQTLRSEGPEVGLEGALGDERLPPELETTLFRVAQEALTNVRKHARAAAVHVVLDRSRKAVRLMVRDEGRGFRPDEATKSNGPGQRVGLSGMRERLSLLDGRFELQSEPGSGTTVTAEVDLPTKREDPDHAG